MDIKGELNRRELQRDAKKACRRSMMATYSVVIFCDDCVRGHFLISGLELANGPERHATIDSFYKPHNIPPFLATLIKNLCCPITKEPKTDLKRIFLLREFHEPFD